MQKKRFLELGCGSGLISIVASKKGASVVATDINPVAVEMLKKNCILNAANLEIIESDLFQHIPEQQFDIIAINPPYYKKTPVTNADHAWFCGENGEYFATLFADITGYMHSTTEILMVLFEGCDMQMIKDHAAKNNFVLHNVCYKQNLLEKTFIYKIEMVI